MMTLAPARTISAIPAIQAVCSAMKSAPTLTVPSAPNVTPASDAVIFAGSASMNESTPKANQGSGSSACRHRRIPDFPELEPPLSTITCVVTRATVRPLPSGTYRIEDCG